MAANGNIGTILAKENRVLEYWRKRYLFQAVVVVVLAGVVIASAICFVPYAPVAAFAVFLVLFVAYVMLKELKEGLQTRGEGLVFSRGEEVFSGLMFDVGRGLCENALLTQEIVQGYQVRECRNVMRGKGYWLEEDWFYAVVSSKFLPLNQTVFEGVVLAFAAAKGTEEATAEIKLAGRQAVVTGKLAPYLRQSGATECATTFLTLFAAEKAILTLADKTLYLWVKTDKKLFYQFSLLKPNTLTAFQKRIGALHEAAEKMVRALNG